MSGSLLPVPSFAHIGGGRAAEAAGRRAASSLLLIAGLLAIAATLSIARSASAAPLETAAAGTARTTCTPIAFGAAPTSGVIAASGATQCYTFTGASADRIRVRVVETSGSLTAKTTVQRPNLTTVCGPTTLTDLTCLLDAAGTHTIVIGDNAGSNTGNFSIAVQRLNNPVGCTALAFGAAPTSGSLGAAAQMSCYTLSGAVGSHVRSRLVKVSGTSLFLTQEVIRPAGTSVCPTTSTVDLTCFLDAAGTHTIVVEDSTGTNTGTFAVSVQNLNAPTGCTALSFGAAPTTASIAAAGEMDCYTFSGSAGDRIRLRTAATSGALFALHEVVRPNGTTVCVTSAALDLTCLLDTTGTHTVLIEDNAGTSTGNYAVAVQRLNNPTGCTAISSGGAPTATSISTAVEMDCYSFSGAAGDQFRVRTVNTGGSFFPLQEVIRPDGSTICGPTVPNDLTCPLDVTGTYRVIVRDSNGVNTGSYSISIRKLNVSSGCTALTFGAVPKTTSIGVAGEMDCFSFTGALGDRIRIRVVETSGGLFALQEVIRPNGTTVCSPSGGTDTTCLLDVAGAHRIIVEDSNGGLTGNYSISIQKVNSPTGCTALSFGAAPVAGSIGSAGQMACFTFSGSSGDAIRLRMANTTGGSFFPIVDVSRPDGSQICGASGPNDSTCTLDDTGQHTVIVRDSNGPNIGGFTMAAQKLNSPTGCTALTVGAAPVAGNIAAAGQMDCYSFSGSAGDRIRVRVVETSGSLFALQEVIRPTGTTVCGASAAVEVTCTLDSGGSDRILVEDSAGANTGTYVIAIQKLNGPTGCTALSSGAAPLVGNIATAGQMDCYSFSGSNGDVLRVRMVNTTGGLFFPLQEVVRPNGTTICGPSGPNDLTCTLNKTGSFTILVRDAAGPNTGSYALSVRKLNVSSGCTALTFGAAPTTGSIGVAGEMDCYSYSGTAGDRIRVRVVETSGSLTALQEVVRPNGTTVCGQSGASDVTCSLDTTGSHRILVVDSGGNSTGNYAISIQKLNAPTGCTALVFGTTPVSGSIGSAGQMTCYTFSGSAGDQMRLRLVNTTGGSFFPLDEVVRPNGTTICGPSGPNDLQCALDTSGAFTVVVRDAAGSNTGSHTLLAQRVNNPVGCTSVTVGGAAVPGTISAAGQLDCFRFSASTGDLINVHVVETSGTLFAVQELMRPNGTTMCGPSGAVDLSCTVDSDGTYTVLVSDSAGTNTGGYTVTVTKLN